MNQSNVSRANTHPYILDKYNNISKICEKYGLYAEIVNYQDGYSVLGAGIYVVVSIAPIPKDIRPHKLCERNIRNAQLFYPKNFAIKLTTDNLVSVFDSIMEFCERSEFLRALYKEFDTPVPDCIRYSEYNGLKSLNEKRSNNSFGVAFQEGAEKSLRDFFEIEKKCLKSKKTREKREFWRSSRYDEKASKLQRRSDFSGRDNPVVRLNVLMQHTNDINKVCIAEDVYQPFVKYIKDCYPDVLIAVDPKEVYEDGMLELSSRLPSNHPALKEKPITSAEFNEIIRRNFAQTGWRCVDHYRPSKWEYRNVYYKEIDEPQFIAALNDLCFRFADCEPMSTLSDRGKCKLLDISVDDLYNFVALAKQQNLLFHIDNRGKFAMPSLNDVHIVYNAKDQEKMDYILSCIIDNNIHNSHVLTEEQLKHAPTLNYKISEAKEFLAGKKLDEISSLEVCNGEKER